MEQVTKVTLSSGRVLFLSEMDQNKEELALKTAESKGASTEITIGYMMQTELLKLLICGVQEQGQQKKLTGTEVEMLYKELKYPEVVELRKVVQKISGEVQSAEPQIELVTGGLS